MMGGIAIGDDFVSEKDGKQGVLDIISEIACHKVNDNGKRIKPDIVFSTDVIMKTFSPRLLKSGPKRDDYERSIDTLFDIRDRLSQIHTEIELLWHVEDDKDE